jgi:hypothetical protein
MSYGRPLLGQSATGNSFKGVAVVLLQQLVSYWYFLCNRMSSTKWRALRLPATVKGWVVKTRERQADAKQLLPDQTPLL